MKARVKPYNNYGGAGAGEIVDVDEEELRRVHWCLEAVDDDADAARARQEALGKPRELTARDIEQIETLLKEADRARAALADAVRENEQLKAENEQLQRELAEARAQSPLTTTTPPTATTPAPPADPAPDPAMPPRQAAIDQEPPSVPTTPVADASLAPTKKGKSK